MNTIVEATPTTIYVILENSSGELDRREVNMDADGPAFELTRTIAAMGPFAVGDVIRIIEVDR